MKPYDSSSLKEYWKDAMTVRLYHGLGLNENTHVDVNLLLQKNKETHQWEWIYKVLSFDIHAISRDIYVDYMDDPTKVVLSEFIGDRVKGLEKIFNSLDDKDNEIKEYVPIFNFNLPDHIECQVTWNLYNTDQHKDPYVSNFIITIECDGLNAMINAFETDTPEGFHEFRKGLYEGVEENSGMLAFFKNFDLFDKIEDTVTLYNEVKNYIEKHQ